MSVITWTPEQRDAFEDRGKNLLVSASAGSGKTTVMTKRIVDLVLGEKIPISNFLVVTFTRASAEDMKKKIIEKFSECDPSDFVTEQIEAVQSSDISDLHSFYSRLISTYFYEAQIDPGYHIVDELESTYLKNKAAEKLFEQREKQEDLEFFKLNDIFQKKRQDTELKNTIFSFGNYLASFADGGEWFNRTLNSSYSTDINQNICAKHINTYVCNRILKYSKLADEFAKKCHDLGEEKYYYHFINLSSNIRVVKMGAPFTQNAKALFEIKFAVLPRVSEKNSFLKDEADFVNKKIKAEIDNFRNNFISPDEKYLVKEIEETKNNLVALYGLVEDFNKIYSSLKREIGGLDFGDLERLAYKILQNEDIANAVRAKYKYVFVDEYQDINEIQEKIISIVSSSNNRFMVGDIKQSIYRFRLCDPEIFLNKYKEYSSGAKDSKVIKLNCNFRSDRNILKFVDRVFSGVMTEEFGAVDYEADSKFIPGDDNQDDKSSTTLCYIDTTKVKEKGEVHGEVYSVKNHVEIETEEGEAIVAEAKYVAGKISEIMENSKVKEKLSDFAILVFSRNAKTAKFVETLKSLNIPVSADEKYDMLTKNYIEEILNYAKLLVCDQDDYLVFKVLKSKLFMFSDSELHDIRKTNPKLKFSDLVKYSKNIENVELSSKLTNFCNITQKFKTVAGTMTIADLCKKIVAWFRLDNLNLLLDNGENINTEIDKFISSLPSKNAYDFLIDCSDFSLIYENDCGGDAVKLMTVHKSKGIEFKYVFVVNTSSKINFESAKGKILYSKDYGVGLDYFDYDLRQETPSIPSSWAKIIEARKIAEEQQRVLYVALTRAAKKLFVVCSKKRDSLQSRFPERPTHYINWFEPIISDCLDGKAHEDFVFEHFSIEELWTVSAGAEKQLLLTTDKSVKKEKTFEYEFEASVSVPLKTSVSKILYGEGVDEDFDDGFEKQEQAADDDTLKSFADRGTAYHKFYELYDFSGKKSFDGKFEETIKKMPENLSVYIEKQKIKAVLDLEFFKTLDSADKIMREREFFASESAEISRQGASGKVIMQGVVDLIVIKNGKITILDYKTGKFDEEKLKKYSFQLNVYSDVIGRAFNMEVNRKLICFTDEQKLIEI